MSETAAREFYDLLQETNQAFKRGSGLAAIRHIDSVSDLSELILLLTAKARDTRDEIYSAGFKNPNRHDELTVRLRQIEKSILNELSKRGGNNGTTGSIINEASLERALSIAEQVENAETSSLSHLSREEQIASTETFIAAVKEWDIEEYAKTALLLKLNGVSRVIQAADVYSESELRYRVKAIIADFATEFSNMDKKHRTFFEEIELWARRGFFAGTTVLGLTADTSAVVGLLAPPALQIGQS